MVQHDFDKMKNHEKFASRRHNVDILEKFLKDQKFNKKYIAEKDDIEVLR